MAPSRARWNIDKPLDPYKRETSKANAALRDYARMGDGRSLSGLIEQFRESPDDAPSLRLPTIKRWSTRFEWQERVAAWATQQQDGLDDEWSKRRLELRESDWQDGQELRDAVRNLIEGLEVFRVTSTDLEEDENGNMIKVITLAYKPGIGEVARAAKTASDLQRMAADEPTDRIELTGAALDSFIERLFAQAVVDADG